MQQVQYHQMMLLLYLMMYETCYHVTTTSSKARYILEVLSNDEYIIVPMTDLMKISMDTLGEISKEYWPLHDEVMASSNPSTK